MGGGAGSPCRLPLPDGEKGLTLVIVWYCNVAMKSFLRSYFVDGFRWRGDGLFLVLTVVIWLAGCVQGQARAVWWWYGSSDRWGAGEILGDSQKESVVLDQFLEWDFDVVYGSYRNLPQSQSNAVAQWNQRLDAAGVESVLLLGDNDWVLPEHRSNLVELVQEHLLDFNAAQTASSMKFDGLHLDMEPQATAEWKTGSSEDKQVLLGQLLDTFEELRVLLDDAGATDVPISAALPVWFDSSSSIGWATDQARDDWFAELGSYLDEISLMAFERESLSSISNAVSWEVANFSGRVYVGLNCDIGPGEEWASFEQFTNRLADVEEALGDSIAGTAVQSFRHLQEARPAGAGFLSFTGENKIAAATLTAGKIYALQSCTNLQEGVWAETSVFTNWAGSWSHSCTGRCSQQFYRLSEAPSAP